MTASNSATYYYSDFDCAMIDCLLAAHATVPPFIVHTRPVTLFLVSGSLLQSASLCSFTMTMSLSDIHLAYLISRVQVPARYLMTRLIAPRCLREGLLTKRLKYQTANEMLGRVLTVRYINALIAC